MYFCRNFILQKRSATSDLQCKSEVFFYNNNTKTLCIKELQKLKIILQT